MPHPGRVPLKKVTIAIPGDLYSDVTEVVRAGRRWISEADFIRHAVANEVDRYKTDHGGQIPLPPGTVTMPERKRREGDR